MIEMIWSFFPMHLAKLSNDRLYFELRNAFQFLQDLCLQCESILSLALYLVKIATFPLLDSSG